MAFSLPTQGDDDVVSHFQLQKRLRMSKPILLEGELLCPGSRGLVQKTPSLRQMQSGQLEIHRRSSAALKHALRITRGGPLERRNLSCPHAPEHVKRPELLGGTERNNVAIKI